MRKIAALFAALPLAGYLGSAHAGALVDLSIIDRSSGQMLEVYRHNGRSYVAGAPGNRYSIVMRNKTGGRLLTVLSIDGINALSGQTAATTQTGYVLPAWQSAEVSGWRKSLDDVAAFYFTRLSDSYAGRTDRPQNVGVIGVAVFREAEPPPPPQIAVQPRPPGALGAAEGSVGGAPNGAPPTVNDAAGERALSRKAESRLGTGHGERIDSPTQYTDFRRAGEVPAEILTIHYDSRANLLAQGIIPRPKPSPTPNPQPNPFPGGFTPDPYR